MIDSRKSPKYQVLRDAFGYETFREGQEPIIDALISGQNILAVMPTGAGKSLCFQVPALVRSGLTIVVSPLVALMQGTRIDALRDQEGIELGGNVAQLVGALDRQQGA